MHQLDALLASSIILPGYRRTAVTSCSAAALKKFGRRQPFPPWRVLIVVGNPTHWIEPPAGYSPYAPKWVRDPCARRYDQLRTADRAEDKTGAEEGIGSILARAGDPLRPETNPSVNRFLERSLQPAIVPYPWPTARHAPVPFNARDILYGSIIGVAAGLAMTLFMIGKLPPAGSIEAGDSNGTAPFAARFAGQPSAGAARIGPASALSHNPVETSPERPM